MVLTPSARLNSCVCYTLQFPRHLNIPNEFSVQPSVDSRIYSSAFSEMNSALFLIYVTLHEVLIQSLQNDKMCNFDTTRLGISGKRSENALAERVLNR